LHYADLRGADLSYSDLREADLSDAYLSRADLSEADLSEADLSGASLFGANFSLKCGESFFEVTKGTKMDAKQRAYLYNEALNKVALEKGSTKFAVIEGLFGEPSGVCPARISVKEERG